MASADVVTVTQSYYNASATAMTYTVTQYAPTASANTTGLMSGSCTLTLSDLNGDGATITRAGANPIYTSTIDDAAAKTLWTSSTFTNFSVGGFMSGSTTPASYSNLDIPAGLPGSGLLGIVLKFTLSAGDSVSFAATFVTTPVPAPGAAAMLMAAGGVGLRRRRTR